jgi:hypothetical protein
MRSEGALALLRDAATRARPVALAREQVLPVLDSLTPLLPDGLRRGTTVAVSGSTALALAVLAGPMAAGSWGVAVGGGWLGLAAAAELGVPLERLVLVDDPPPSAWATVLATVVDAFDVVLVAGGPRVRPADARRLATRARERGAVLVVAGPPGGGHPAWPEPADVSLVARAGGWEGLEDGHGYLRGRRVAVEAEGRRAAARVRRAVLWLPDRAGAAILDGPAASVHHLDRSSTEPGDGMPASVLPAWDAGGRAVRRSGHPVAAEAG